eukprot:TRINITY_DN11897_c0_g3_i1.p1 TRINITY_DN11897_c0_g3~~TRINITY_DN11897_c0_g3_i1.p1  ORF type:complete len:1136 (-),score=178.31 TRINITY_DN11897_c0_g3_i1:199-3606(-)
MSEEVDERSEDVESSVAAASVVPASAAVSDPPASPLFIPLDRRRSTRIAVRRATESGSSSSITQLESARARGALGDAYVTSPAAMPLKPSLPSTVLRYTAARVDEQGRSGCRFAGDALTDNHLIQAAEWLATADALLVGTGVDMGQGSNLSTQQDKNLQADAAERSNAGVSQARHFSTDTQLAWDISRKANQNSTPYAGYDLVQAFAQQAPLGAFSFTCNVDSHWLRSGWSENKLVECNGAARWLQCSAGCSEKVWDAPECLGPPDANAASCHAVEGATELPLCPTCGACALPAIKLPGGEPSFSNERIKAQVAAYETWINGLKARTHWEHLRVVCLEIGCPSEDSSVREELERVAKRFPSARIIRINRKEPEIIPGDSNLRERVVCLAMSSQEALEQLQAQLRHLLNSEAFCESHFIIRDHQNVVRDVLAPIGATPLRVLHLLERSGVSVEYGPLHVPRDPPKEPYAVFFTQFQTPEFSSLLSQSPKQCFYCPPGPELQEGGLSKATACFQAMNVRFQAENSAAVKEGVDWCHGLLSEFSKKFESPEYQEQVRQKQERRGIAELFKAIQEELLPMRGLTADERGVEAMQAKIWFYGCCDPEIFRLADQTLRLSYLRLTGHLPWKQMGQLTAQSSKQLHMSGRRPRAPGQKNKTPRQSFAVSPIPTPVSEASPLEDAADAVGAESEFQSKDDIPTELCAADDREELADPKHEALKEMAAADVADMPERTHASERVTRRSRRIAAQAAMPPPSPAPSAPTPPQSPIAPPSPAASLDAITAEERTTDETIASLAEAHLAPPSPAGSSKPTGAGESAAIPPSPRRRMTRRAAAAMAESQMAPPSPPASLATTAAEESSAIMPPSPPRRMTRRAATIMPETRVAPSSPATSIATTSAEEPLAFPPPSPPRRMTRRVAALMNEVQKPPKGGSSGSQDLGPGVDPHDVADLAVDVGMPACRKSSKRVQGRAKGRQEDTAPAAEEPEVMIQPSSRRPLTRRAAAVLSDVEGRPSGSCDSSAVHALTPNDDKTEDIGNKEPAGKRKCSKKSESSVKKTKRPETPDVSAAVSREPFELAKNARGGLCRGAVVRILSDPTCRGMTGVLEDYDRSADSWQVSGDFDLGSKWIPASNLAFFVGKRPR